MGIEYTARHLLPISRIHFGKVQKSCLFNLSTVFGWTHFAIQRPYISSGRCEVSFWQQQLECECNAKLWRNAQSTEPASFWRCSCTAYSIHFPVGSLRTKFQVPNFLFSSLWQHGRGKLNVPTATENLLGKRLSYKSFFGQNILCIPNNGLLLHLWAGFSKAYRKPRAFNCLHWCIRVCCRAPASYQQSICWQTRKSFCL